MTSRKELLALAVHRETIKECIAVVEALFQSAAHGGATEGGEA